MMINRSAGEIIKKFDDGCIVIRHHNELFSLVGLDEGIRPFIGALFGYSDFANPEHIANVTHNLLCPFNAQPGKNQGTSGPAD